MFRRFKCVEISLSDLTPGPETLSNFSVGLEISTHLNPISDGINKTQWSYDAIDVLNSFVF